MSQAATNLTVSPAGHRRPSPLEPRLLGALGSFHSALEPDFGDGSSAVRHAIFEASAPSEADRAELARRRLELVDALQPAGVEATICLVAELLAAFPSMGADESGAIIQVEKYAKTLANETVWALKAMSNWVDNSGRDFLPSAPALRKIAYHFSEPFHRELQQIDAVLAARVYRVSKTGPEKQRISAGLREIGADLESTSRKAPPREGDFPRQLERMAGSISARQMLAAMKRSADPIPSEAEPNG